MIAVHTHTMPSAWLDETDEMIATVVDIIETQAKEAQAARRT